MCNCHNEMMEKVKEKVDIPGGATDIDFEWKGKVFRLDGKNSDPCPPRVEFSFRAPKKDGGHRANKTSSSTEESHLITHREGLGFTKRE